jgi:hypothetical protein
MAFWNRNKNAEGLRVIKTARDKASINRAAKNGLRPLIKKVEPSHKIRSKYAVVQNRKTGEIITIGDFRSDFYSDSDDYEIVIDWTDYYPHNFTSPFAAYLIPKDIKKGAGSTWSPYSLFATYICISFKDSRYPRDHCPKINGPLRSEGHHEDLYAGTR